MKVRKLTTVVLGSKIDRALADLAEQRMATFDRNAAKTHAEVWSTSKRPRRRVAFSPHYHPGVGDQDISLNLHRQIADAIESRLTLHPHQYGAPLQKTLKGYWKLRVGDYRVVYKLEKDDVLILAIRHRKRVYDDILLRIDQGN